VGSVLGKTEPIIEIVNELVDSVNELFQVLIVFAVA
jgi:hypothetical protein